MKRHSELQTRGVGRWFGKGGLYRSIGKGSMIRVYKIEPIYVTSRKHKGALAPRAPIVPTPMLQTQEELHDFDMNRSVAAEPDT